MAAKDRDNTFDTISGIMICWMVIYHALLWGQQADSPLFTRLLSCLYFFMPWFYFKSGFYSSTPRTLQQGLRLNAQKLIRPMLIWTMIGYIITLPTKIYFEQQTLLTVFVEPLKVFLLTGDTRGNEPLWFFWSLFMVKICLIILQNWSCVTKALLLPLLALTGWFLHTQDLILPIGLSTLPLGLCFALAGYLCHEWNIHKRMQPALLVLFVIAISIFFPNYIDIHLNTLWYGSYWGYIISSILAILAIARLMSPFSLPVLAWMGRKSLFVFVIHWPVFEIIGFVYKAMEFNRDNLPFSILLTTVSLSVCILLAYFVSARALYLGESKF